MKRIIGMSLVFVMLLCSVFAFASCGEESAYEGIKNALETAGYKASTDEAANKAVTDTAALYTDTKYQVNLYAFDKDGKYVVIVAFASVDDIKAQEGYSDFNAKGLIKGNCLAVPYPADDTFTQEIAGILSAIK